MPLSREHKAVLHELCRLGDLSCLQQEHLLPDAERFEAWNVERQTPEHQAEMAERGALFDNLWVDEMGRRVGKTGKWLIHDVQQMLRIRGARGMIGTPKQKDIGGIIVPLTKLIFKDLAGTKYFPRYVGTRGADHEGLYVEATDSYCKLVGLDVHPDASRGQWLDFCHLTEAAFIKGLYELVTAVIMPQFRYRPHAWLAMETSTAKVPDCDFNREFRPDAQLRGTYRKMTIRDNPTLSEEEIAKEERRSGGTGSSVCRRELYCEEVRDEDEMIVPEFDEAVHVVDPSDWPLPRQAYAYVGIDPGTTDPLGLCFAYDDFERQTLVIQGAWQRANASSGYVASVLEDYEGHFWGSRHKERGARGRDVQVDGAEYNGAGKLWQAPEGALTFWSKDTRSLTANPFMRVSDVDNRFILDLNRDYATNVQAAEKRPGSKDLDVLHLRFLFQHRASTGYPQVVILKNGHTEPLIAQLRSGTWNTDETGHRTDWARTKALGHCDCLAALKYLARVRVPNRNPMRPAIVDAVASEIHIPDRMREHLRRPEAVPTYGARKSHSFPGRRNAGGFGR